MDSMKSAIRLLPLLIVLAGAYYWFFGRSLLGQEMPELGQFQVVSKSAVAQSATPEEGWRLFAFFRPG